MNLSSVSYTHRRNNNNNNNNNIHIIIIIAIMTWSRHVLMGVYIGLAPLLVLWAVGKHANQTPRFFWTTLFLPLALAAVEILGLAASVVVVSSEEFARFELFSLNDTAWKVALLVTFGSSNLIKLATVVVGFRDNNNTIGMLYEPSPHSISITSIAKQVHNDDDKNEYMQPATTAYCTFVIMFLVCPLYLSLALVFILFQQQDDFLNMLLVGVMLLACSILLGSTSHLLSGDNVPFKLTIVWEIFELLLVGLTLVSTMTADNAQDWQGKSSIGLGVATAVGMYSLYADIATPRKLEFDYPTGGWLLHAESLLDHRDIDNILDHIEYFAPANELLGGEQEIWLMLSPQGHVR